MIRNDSEYQEAVRRLQTEEASIVEKKKKLEEEGFTIDEIKRLVDPFLSFHLQLREEVGAYERLKRRDFGEIKNLVGMGQMLVGLRIALGVSQKELADRLKIDPSQVSRDERNEYHGIRVERVTEILEALGVNLTTSVVDVPKPTPSPSVAA